MLTIKPKTRKEIYLAYLSGDMSLELPEPLTRDEVNLYNLCKNKAYGEYTTVKEVLAECQPEMVATEEGFSVGVLDGLAPIAVGETYIVSLNGTDYKVTTQATSELDIVFGNLSLAGMEDTGEPFFASIAMIEDEAGSYYSGEIFILDGSTTLTISIRQEVTEVKKISGKYVEGMGYVDVGKYLLTERTVPSTGKWTELPGFELVDGEEYIVSINGKDYPCVGESMRQGIVALQVYDESGAELLEVNAAPGDPAQFKVKQNVLGASFTLSIRETKETIHPIDPKFLPSGGGATIVTFSPDADGNIVADRTLSELLDAYKNGSVVQGRVAEAPGAYTTLSVGTVTMEDNSDGAPAEMNFYFVRFIVTGLEFIGITYGENNNISFVTKELTA